MAFIGASIEDGASMTQLDPGPFDQYAGPGGNGRRRRWPIVLLGVTLAVFLLGGAGVVWVQRQIDPPGSPGAPVQVTVTKGMSTAEIGRLLQRRGVITNSTVFRYYTRVNGTGSIQAGDYTLRKRQSMSDVVDILSHGAESKLDRVTIPEGLTLEEIAKRVGELPGRDAAKFLAAARSGTVRSQLQPADSKNLEGLLLPETYFVSDEDDETRILARMVDAFDQLANRLDIRGASQKLGITPYQAVIVASMVEREARVDQDRGSVARVVYNRLEKGMPLQIDATIQFALGKQKQSLLLRDLEIDSPYNTYKIKGLPPGPIANPGQKSLQAALEPTPGPWIYYVLADADGHHAFTDSSAEFGRLKAQAQAKGLL